MSDPTPTPPPLVRRADLTPVEVRNFSWVDVPTVDGRALRVREPSRVERSLLQIRMAGYATETREGARAATASAEQMVNAMLDIAVMLAIDGDGRALGLTRDQAGELLCSEELQKTFETASLLLSEGVVADALGLSERAAERAAALADPAPDSGKKTPPAKPRAPRSKTLKPAKPSATSSTS